MAKNEIGRRIMDKQSLRYRYQNGVATLIEFDRFTREPLDSPKSLQGCSVCEGGCCYYRHQVTPDDGVWMVNRDSLEEHLAREIMAKNSNSLNFFSYEGFGFFCGVVSFLLQSAILVIMMMMELPPFGPNINSYIQELMDMAAHLYIDEHFCYGAGILFAILFMTGPLLLVPLTAGLIGLLWHRRIITPRLKKKNGGVMPKRPSDNWRDYLPMIPKIDFPLPPTD